MINKLQKRCLHGKIPLFRKSEGTHLILYIDAMEMEEVNNMNVKYLLPQYALSLQGSTDWWIVPV